MTERYYITGAQMGTIRALLKYRDKIAEIETELKQIEDNQFVGNMKGQGDTVIIRRAARGTCLACKGD